MYINYSSIQSCLNYIVGSSFEDDSPLEGGPASGGVGSVLFINGFGGVGPA